MRTLTTTVPVALVLLLLASCPPPAANSTPAQVTVANSVNLLAQTLPAASSAIIAARNQGNLSAEDARNAQNVVVAITTTGKQVNAILRSPNPWKAQRNAILLVVANNGVQEASKRLPITAAAALSASMALLNQIVTAVGGTT